MEGSWTNHACFPVLWQGLVFMVTWCGGSIGFLASGIGWKYFPTRDSKDAEGGLVFRLSEYLG